MAVMVVVARKRWWWLSEIFDDTCDPVVIQNTEINHFLYADDLVLLSESKNGLQRSIDKVSNFAKAKRLTISTKKSKTMVFNLSGKFLRDIFVLDGNTLEPVQSFCYLGIDIKCSGTMKHAMNVLNDKGGKALRPLLHTMARFNIPVKTSIKLFNTFISPILLYNTENLTCLSDKELTKFDHNFIFSNIASSKIDVTHRKFLKFVMGVSKSCPNVSIYGETGEIPLSLKSYRLTLNFWYRITNLPDTSLVKQALLENIHLRTNWIRTIEVLVNTLELTDKIGNHSKFMGAAKSAVDKGYQKWWKTVLQDSEQSRLSFYKKVKSEFEMENYLNITNFQQRRHISKLRCSDHGLEIEKGRHKNTPRNERLCKLCKSGQIEDEEHFLLDCSLYSTLRLKYNFEHINEVTDFFTGDTLNTLGKYLKEAFEVRDTIVKINGGTSGR